MRVLSRAPGAGQGGCEGMSCVAGRTEIRLDSLVTPLGEPRLEIADEPVLDLGHEMAVDSLLVGAKAASLAAAGRLGLPVLPGFVVTTSAIEHLLTKGRLADSDATHLRRAWSQLAQGGSRSLVVRSSPLAESRSPSSPGVITSVTDVLGFEKFMDALKVVAHSSKLSGRSERDPAPMGVLVQPYVDATPGGVLYGIDPTTGAADRLVIDAVEGSPEKFAAGKHVTRHVVKKNGRIIEVDTGGGAPLDSTRRRDLARLAVQAERSFGAPQEIEWVIDTLGRLWLLQTQAITAKKQIALGTGTILGPEPVAEKFPGQLSLLEEELWVEPLRASLRHALVFVRGASRNQIKKSPILVTVGGRVAADLELLQGPSKRSFLHRIDARASARRIVASRRVGGLRKVFPSLTQRLLETVDYESTKVPPLSELADIGLVDLLKRSQRTLTALNGHELLAEILIGRGAPARVVANQSAATGNPLIEVRDMCRLRAGWLYELTGRVSEELGHRFSRGEVLQHESDIKLLRIAEIEEMILTDIFPPELDRRGVTPTTPPLPGAFRLSEDGRIVEEDATERSHRRGVVISGVSWCLERTAAIGTQRFWERRLALKLAPISLPEDGVTDPATTGPGPL